MKKKFSETKKLLEENIGVSSLTFVLAMTFWIWQQQQHVDLHQTKNLYSKENSQ